MKVEKTKEEKEAILNKIFLKVAASKTALNGFYKPNVVNNVLENDFDKYFGNLGKKENNHRQLNENELKFVNVRKEHENKEFRERILKDKEKILKNDNLKAKSNSYKNNNNQIDKEVLFFNDSFNNISLIEQLEKIEGLDEIDFQSQPKEENCPINSSFDKQKEKASKGIDVDINNAKKITDLIKDIDIDVDIEIKDIPDNFKPFKRDSNDSIDIELSQKPTQRNSTKNVEGSTKISKNENSKINRDESINNKKKKETNKSNENDFEENKLCKEEPKFSKTGANFFQMKSENVPDLLKRIMEKNKKEASVKQRDCFSQMINQNLNRNGKFILNMERPRTQHSSKTIYMKKEQQQAFEEINFDLRLSDVFFWRKHEELWANLSNTSKFKIDKEFDSYFIPKYESEILISIFFKLNDIIKDKIEITDKIFQPKHEIKKWKEAYKVAIKRWHPDKLIPLLVDIQVNDDVKKNYILKKCGTILNSINKQMNTIIEILKKIANKQAPVL